MERARLVKVGKKVGKKVGSANKGSRGYHKAYKPGHHHVRLEASRG